MPALPAVPQTLKLTHRWVYGSDTDIVARWFLSYSGTAPSDATLNTIAANIYNAWEVVFAPETHPDVTFAQITLEDLTSSTSGVGTHIGSVVGTLSGDLLPAQCAVLGNMQIARRYRGGKPRTYWPLGTSSSLQTAQTWTSGFISNINAAFAQYLTDLAGEGTGGTTIGGPVNVSYYSGFTVLPPDRFGRVKTIPKVRTSVPTPDPISAVLCNTRPGTQRRRVRNG